jgi:two-component system sensor histidine kinase KdpD
LRGPKWSDLWPSEQLSWPPYALAGVASVLALLLGLVIQPWFGLESVDLVFLAAIVGVAIQFGLWPSVFCSIVSSLFYNFFFIPPLYTFTIADPRNVWAFLFFAAMGIGISNVAGRARSLAVVAIRRAKMTESLYGFSRKLTGVGALDDVLWAAAYQAALMLKVRVVLLLPEDGSLVVKTGYPPEDQLDSADLAAARWTWENQHAAGRGSDTLPGAKRLFVPMRTARTRIGVIGIDGDKPGVILSPDERRLFDSLVDQTALAIERVMLVKEMDRAQRSAETERLRSALLTSLSHDLRTPLSAVIATAQTLRDMSGQFSESQKAELLATILDESERLNRFIANLLDMTKLESGAVVARTSLHNVSEVVGGTLRRASKILSDHRVELDLSPDLPMVELDDVLFEQVLFNLLDNAAKYAPAGTTVQIVARRINDHVRIEVMDEGEGIPPADLEHIFDKFYRIQKQDRVRAGTGLGLAIARGFIKAMKGEIVATNRIDRSGARFLITLPVPQSALREEKAA